jgi:hypothetical protein
VNTRIVTKDIANFSRALSMAFDLLDYARTNISRTENARLLCQCHYLSTNNQTEEQHELSCPSDTNGSSLMIVSRENTRTSCLILASAYKEGEDIFLDSTGCNKMIMIVTDGATETAINVFQARNWYPNNISTCHSIEVKTKTIPNQCIFDRSFLSRQESSLT